jgi:hypothetical protein
MLHLFDTYDWIKSFLKITDVNRLGDYICVCLTFLAPTELETVGNDSCSIPEEEEEEDERKKAEPYMGISIPVS